MSFDTEGLRAATDIVAVIGSYTPLVRVGSEWKGCCPIHGGDGQNLYVNPVKRIWACFSAGCHEGAAGADVIGFIQLVEGKTFREACEFLGAKNDWKPNLSKPPKPPMPVRVTSRPPAEASVPDMAMRHLGEPVRTWAYKDADGGLLGYVARYDTEDGGKEIRCWTWGSVDGAPPTWGCGAWSKPRPLYGLDRLATRADAPVLIVEGEKACDAAGRLLPQYVAVTWPGGAQAWKHANWRPVMFRRVLMWPDADEPGIACMAALAGVLGDPDGLACSVRIIDPSGQEPGADAADWAGTREELIAWAKPRTRAYVAPQQQIPDNYSTESSALEGPAAATPGGSSPRDIAPVALDPSTAAQVSPDTGESNGASTEPEAAVDPSGGPVGDDRPPDATDIPPQAGTTAERPKRGRKPRLIADRGNAVAAPDPDAEVLPLELSEVGVAKQFCDLYHADFKVVHEWGGKHGAVWLSWDGQRWAREANRKTAYQRMTGVCMGLKYHAAARGLTEASKGKFETVKFISACLTQAQFDARLIAAPDIWDADPMLLGTPDGTVDLRMGKLIAPEREHYITRSTTVAPQQGPHPLFDDVIRRLAAEDPDMTAYLWRLFGYTITGCVNEEIFAYVFGRPQTGKTTLSECLADILAPSDAGGYACHVDIEMFTESKQDKGTDRLAHLAGSRYAYASEMEEGRNFKSALLKLAVGGDRLSGRFLYAEQFSFRPTHTLYIWGNQIMHLRTADGGIRRRMHLIEYDERFVVSDAERDNDFKRKLTLEYPAILSSMIRGALDWQQCGGLGRPERIESRVDDYMQSEDTLAEFVDQCLDVAPANTARSAAAYAAFKSYCERSGEYCPSGKRFTQQMRARGFSTKRSAIGMLFEGFSVKPAEAPPQPEYYDR